MNVEYVLNSIIMYFSDPVLLDHLKNILFVCIGCFAIAGVFRLVFGKQSTAIRSVRAVFGILIIYCLRVVLTRYDISMNGFLAEFPFAQIGKNAVEIFSLATAEKPAVYFELLNLIALTFLFCLLEDLLPTGSNLFVWLLLRCVSVAGALLGYSLFRLLIVNLLPDFIITYAPMLLLALLAIFLAVTVFKWLFGIILGLTVGPLIGGIYTFFISHIVGRQLTKSALCSAVLLFLVYLSGHYGIYVIQFNDPIGLVLLPVVLVLSAVWYILSKLF